jgi:hypothetical protein
MATTPKPGGLQTRAVGLTIGVARHARSGPAPQCLIDLRKIGILRSKLAIRQIRHNSDEAQVLPS